MFFWSDVFGTCMASLAFALVLFLPGYVCGFFLNLFGFQTLSSNWRIVVSVPLSIAISPICGYFLLGFGHIVLNCAVVAVLLFLGGAVMKSRFGKRPARVAIPPIALWITLGWFVIGLLMLADMQFGNRVYFSSIATDHEFRVAVIDAITRTGLPPATPFNYLGGAVIMKYHVFWFGLCSIVQQLGFGLWNARHALNASVLWTGFGLLALIPLSLRFFEAAEGDSLRRRSILGACFLAVTGLDLLPNILLLLQHNILPDDMEWWSPNQITSWPDAVLWVPHHVGALVAGLTGFFLIWHAAVRVDSQRARNTSAFVAGASFASAVGCSIYIGLVFAVVLAAWTAFTVVRRWWRHSVPLIVSGLTATLLSIPNLLQILGAGGKGGGKFIDLQLWVNRVPAAEIAAALRIHNRLIILLFRLVGVTFTYSLEFGVFFLVGLIVIHRFWKSKTLRPQDMATLVLGGVALLLCTCVRSATISNNDLGWRGFMVVQFILLLWATDVFEGPLTIKPAPPATAWQSLAMITLFLGAAGTFYQLTWLRVSAIVADTGIYGPDSVDTNVGVLTYSLRSVYSRLDQLLPHSAIVQSNPETDIDFWWGLYSHRQIATTGGAACNTSVGGDPDVCAKAYPRIRRLFDASLKDPSEARAIARTYRISAVVISEDDEVWDSKDAWFTKMKPVASAHQAKAFLMD